MYVGAVTAWNSPAISTVVGGVHTVGTSTLLQGYSKDKFTGYILDEPRYSTLITTPTLGPGN